jgi:hypothetical protein
MKILRALWTGLRGVGRALGVAGRATIALVGICGVGVAIANYAMTQGSGTTFGSIVVSTVHYVQMLSCDPATPSQCGAVTATGGQIVDVATSSNQLHTDLAAINSTAGAPLAAGENHVGEIGSNQIKVDVAQTVTASAYSSGNALGGLMTIANAARNSGAAGTAGTGGIVTGMQLNSKALQSGVQVDVFYFDANPTGSTCTDKTAFVIANADFNKVVGIQSIPSTPANGAGWFGATTTGAVGIPSYFPVTYDLASSTSIFACAVVRAAITPGSTSDISFKFNVLRN